MFNETVTLILKHADIDIDTSLVSASSNCGSWTNGKQSTTWNVNLRNLLGNVIYDNNDLFVLRLNQFAYSTANFPASVYDNQLIFKMRGLNFRNSTYNPKTGNNSGEYQMLVANLITNASETFSLSPNISMCNFMKSSENVQITIELFRSFSDLPAQYGVEKFPHMCFSFDIYPVKNI